MADRELDALDSALLLKMQADMLRAFKSKYSLPGGPDEQASGKKYPMQALYRYEDPLDEIVDEKGVLQGNQRKMDRIRREMIRHKQMHTGGLYGAY